GVSAVPDEGKVTAREPGQRLGEHLAGQVGAAGLALAGQVQACQQRQGQGGGVVPGGAGGHRQDPPAVPAGGGRALGGGCDGVAEPSQAPNAVAAFVGQGVIDQQRDAAEELHAGEDQHANAVGQALRRPGGACEEVVVGVQAVALGKVGDVLRVGRVAD